MDQVEVLTQLAGGKGQPVDTEAIKIKAEEGKISNWLEKNKNISDPQTKIDLFTTEFRPSSQNKRAYWDTLENLMPGSKESSQKVILDNEKRKLQDMKTTEEKENYLRDVAETLPSYAVQELFPYMQNLFSLHTNKEKERSRIAVINEVNNLLAESEFNLSPEVGLPTHVRDYITAYNMGFNKEITTDNQGRISVPGRNGLDPVFSLPQPVQSLEEEYISYNDLSKPVENKLKKLQKNSRDEAVETERTIRKSLLSRYEELPREFQANALIDGVMELEDPVQEIRTRMSLAVKNKLENSGVAYSSKELREMYYQKVNDTKEALVRRITDGYTK